MSSKQKQIIVLAVISCVLLYIIIKWGSFLSNKCYFNHNEKNQHYNYV